jgi:uncharacterized protein YeaC (DUF1315 family)
MTDTTTRNAKLARVQEQLKTADTAKIVRLRAELAQAIETGINPQGRALTTETIQDARDVMELYDAEIAARG